MSERVYLTKREFYGDEHYAWIQKTYDSARVHLKNCGRPLTEFDKFLITESKWTANYFKQKLD